MFALEKAAVSARKALLNEPDEVHDEAVEKAANDLRFSVRVQRSTGTLAAAFLDKFLPQELVHSLAKELLRVPTLPKVDKDPKAEKIAEEAKAAGEKGRSLVEIADLIASLLSERKYEAIPAIAELVLTATEGEPALENLRAKVRQNLGTAYTVLERFEEAEAQFQQVAAISASLKDGRLLGLASNGIAEVGLQRDCMPAQVFDADVNSKFARVEAQLESASTMLPGKRYPAVGMLSLADKAQELGQRELATRLARRAEKHLSIVPKADIQDLRNATSRRERWPFITKRKRFFARYVPTLIASAVLVAASTILGSGTAFEGAGTTESVTDPARLVAANEGAGTTKFGVEVIRVDLAML